VRTRSSELPLELERLPELVLEQVDVGVERERRGVVPEPPLYLFRVGASFEEHRSTGVPEGVEACPRRADLLGDRPEHPPHDVGVVERPADLGREHEVLVARPLGVAAALAQLGHERPLERHVALGVPRLRRAVAPAHEGAADLDVRRRAVEREVLPAQRDALGPP